MVVKVGVIVDWLDTLHSGHWLVLDFVVFVSIANVLFWLCVVLFLASTRMAVCVICGTGVLPIAFPEFGCHPVYQVCIVWLV